MLFGDAVRLQHLPLPFGRAAAVAAHRRHDEWLGAKLFQMPDDRSDDLRNIGDATTPASDGDALAWTNRVAKLQLGELPLDFAGNIGDPRPFEFLANPEKLGVSASIHVISNPIDESSHLSRDLPAKSTASAYPERRNSGFNRGGSETRRGRKLIRKPGKQERAGNQSK